MTNSGWGEWQYPDFASTLCYQEQVGSDIVRMGCCNKPTGEYKRLIRYNVWLRPHGTDLPPVAYSAITFVDPNNSITPKEMEEKERRDNAHSTTTH